MVDERGAVSDVVGIPSVRFLGCTCSLVVHLGVLRVELWRWVQRVLQRVRLVSMGESWTVLAGLVVEVEVVLAVVCSIP